MIHYVHFCLLVSCGEKVFADMEHLLAVPLPMTVVLQLSQNVLVVMMVLHLSRDVPIVMVVLQFCSGCAGSDGDDGVVTVASGCADCNGCVSVLS